MRFLKRFFWAILLLAFLLGGAYWWRYKKEFVYTQVVLSDANMLIDIDLRAIEHSLLWDFIAHPFSGIDLSWSFGEDDDEQDENTPSKGLSIPRHLVVFTKANQPSVWFSAPIPINGIKFSAYADSLLARKTFIKIDNNFVFDSKKNFFYHWSENEITVAFAKENQAKFIQINMQNLLWRKEVKKLPKELVAKTQLSQHHVRFWHKPSALTNNKPVLLYADFLKGAFNIEGDVPFKFVFPIEQQASIKSGQVVNFWANLDWRKNGFADFIQEYIPTRDFSKWTSMSRDTVLQYWDGTVSIQVPSIESSIDSIVTYEYDDDFNKIEKVTTQKSIKPKTIIQFSSRDSTLYNYAKSVGMIKSINREVRYVGFPLLTLYATPSSQALTLSTEPILPKMDYTRTQYFLYFESNIQAYPALLDYLPFHANDDQKAKIKTIAIQCRQLPNSRMIHFTGKITSTSEKRFLVGY